MAPATREAVVDRSQEQRSSYRFPIRAALKYQFVAAPGVVKTGVGYSINISSRGLLFEAIDSLPVGIEINLAMEWPARLDQRIGLTFQILGRIVRVSAGRTAVVILKHEFRIRPSASRAEPAAARPRILPAANLRSSSKSGQQRKMILPGDPASPECSAPG